MLLRNKKTGKITEIEEVNLIVHDDKCDCYESFAEYHSLAELNEEWEDCKPIEPLIKDEKIRKAVRAWAEANDIAQVSHDACWNAFRCTDFVIAFDYDFDRHDGFEDMKSYTIDELCGEEEE